MKTTEFSSSNQRSEEFYPERTGETTWVLPAVSKRIVKFKESLAKEPPIPLGTPDPFNPGSTSK
jgi:hypothetical protein